MHSYSYSFLPQQQIDNNSTDACGISSISLSKTIFTCDDVGANTVTLTATDNNGNQAICTAKVTVTGDDLDTDGTPNVCDSDDDGDGLKDVVDPCPLLDDKEPPIAKCKDHVVSLDANGNGAISPGNIDNGSTDNCGIPSVSLSQSKFGCGFVGRTNSVVLTVTDVHSNENNCTASVMVEDNIPPNAKCRNITVSLDSKGSGSVAANVIASGTSDNCELQSVKPSKTKFGCTDVGSEEVFVTATDIHSNSASCSAIVTVEDAIAPVAICRDVYVQLDDKGAASIAAAQINNGSSDACGIASLALDVDTFTYADVGDNTITLTVTDGNGNIDTCTATVFVADVPSSSPSNLPSASPSLDPSTEPSRMPSQTPSLSPSGNPSSVSIECLRVIALILVHVDEFLISLFFLLPLSLLSQT